MRIAIFGGTGPTGRLAIDAALRAGHTVTAYARDTTTLERRTRVIIVAGPLDDPAAIDRVVGDADAVLSLLGPRSGSRRDAGPGGDAVSVGTASILGAMDAHGVRRLVAVSHAVVRDRADHLGIGARARLRLSYAPKGSAYREIVRTAGLVRGSAVDWTLVRAVRLTDGPRGGRARMAAMDGALPGPISRADLADALIREVDDGAHVRQSPVASEAG